MTPDVYAVSVLEAAGATVEPVECKARPQYGLDEPRTVFKITPRGRRKPFIVQGDALVELALDEVRRQRLGEPAATGKQLALGGVA